MNDLFAKIDRLFHDAERAEGGASMARAMGDDSGADRLSADAKALRDEAHQLDPDHTAPAWTEDEDELQAIREANAAFAEFMRRHQP